MPYRFLSKKNKSMTEQEIKEYICVRFPQENESCEWKEYKNLQNSLCGHEADDVVSYVSAISNMNGGSLIIGVKDQTLDIIGIQSFGSYNVDSAKARIAEKCRNLPLEDFDIMEFKADDTGRIVWVLNIPKHQAKLPVYAHNKAWQRTGDALVEYEDDHLIFQNYGSFLPSSIEEVVEEDCPQSIYRNRFLVEAMRNLNMIETEGGGIRKLFLKQSERYFPLPDFDLSGGKVKVTIEGNVKDENFAKILSANPNLELADIVLLDKVQKGIGIADVQAKYLRKRKFIEGRKPKYYLSYEIVSASNDSVLKRQYVKNKSFDDDYFRKLILNYLEKFETASRNDIDLLLEDKLSDVLNEKQKKNKIDYLMKQLRLSKLVVCGKGKLWKLV